MMPPGQSIRQQGGPVMYQRDSVKGLSRGECFVTAEQTALNVMPSQGLIIHQDFRRVGPKTILGRSWHQYRQH